MWRNKKHKHLTGFLLQPCTEKDIHYRDGRTASKKRLEKTMGEISGVIRNPSYKLAFSVFLKLSPQIKAKNCQHKPNIVLQCFFILLALQSHEQVLFLERTWSTIKNVNNLENKLKQELVLNSYNLNRRARPSSNIQLEIVTGLIMTT